MNKTAPMATLAILAAFSLSACMPGGPTDPDETGATPTATSSAEETPRADEDDEDAGLDPDVLFVISATATAPNGALATLVQTVYKPVSTTNQQGVDEAALDSECGGWRDEFPAAEYVISLIDVTDQSPDGSSWDRSVAVASMNGWPAFSGEVDTFQAYCASYQVNLGASRAVTPITAGSGAEGPHGWAHILYGFGIPTEAGQDTAGPNDTLLSNCQIELSTEAATSPIASAWAWDGNPLSCSFGEYDFGV